MKKPHVAGICVAYRSKVFHKAGGFDVTRHTLEDFVLSEKVSQFGKILLNKNTSVFTSTRRIQKWGYREATRKYLKLYLQYLLTKKSFRHAEYEPIR